MPRWASRINLKCMADRQHYVSQFHLRSFVDPESEATRSPWLWVGNCATGKVKRRAPSNIAWARSLFDGAGALGDRGAKLETYLADSVESPAAAALREFCGKPAGRRGEIPSTIMRYLAWAAARSRTMWALYQSWIDDIANDDTPLAEPPPPWLMNATERDGVHRVAHPQLGTRLVGASEYEAMRFAGWRFVVEQPDFLELAHAQAAYFYERFFPRLNWMILDAPRDQHFVIGDRPVLWGFHGAMELPPAYLRHAAVQLVAPLSRTVALLAGHAASPFPERVTSMQVNQIVANGATEWIAGATRKGVEAALNSRNTIRKPQTDEPGDRQASGPPENTSQSPRVAWPKG
ncbi:MAG: hypothetical protein JWM41_3407 [Gemmatimonadetes bacterium]|nr:hypothetical protein [Gemmatimonadota bacterium]